MNERTPNLQYCPICGKRQLPYLGSQTIVHGSWTTTFQFYAGNSSEPACFGHRDTPTRSEQMVISKAFYDAFADQL